MRLSHRLIACLVAGVSVVSIVFARADIQGRVRDLQGELIRRTSLEVRAAAAVVGPLVRQDAPDRVEAALDRLQDRSDVTGLIVFNRQLRTVAGANSLPASLRARARELAEGLRTDEASESFQDGDAEFLLYAQRLRDTTPQGVIVAVRDSGFIKREAATMWRHRLLRVAIEVGVVALMTLLILRWGFVGPITRTARWLQDHRLGKGEGEPVTRSDFIQPLLGEVTHLIRRLETARAAAQEEARLRDAGESVWTAERLRAHIRARIVDAPLFVVSNREPYMDIHRDGRVHTLVPASGLVTALEPVLRACNGTWIAHGSGSADRERVDVHDRVRVPPEQPEYSLRRVWLTTEEEDGYYYGFSNEGLWPLCHIAHQRPLFRESDWSHYQTANRKFADAVLDEIHGTPDAMVLVQDYHFALLPRLIKRARPDARVGVFWHIPWPNPEAFGICPWQADLLDGLLGADLIGFHTQAHCNNFLATVDHAFESQIEWDHFTAKRHDHVTLVRRFPISVAAQAGPREPADPTLADTLRTSLLKQHGVAANFLGVGVDRVDYTKGILERFRGLERFFEKWNRYIGEFTFVQIGAPSRTHIRRYQELLDEVIAEAARINGRFARAGWKPIVLLTRHHGHDEIDPYYRAADFCMVTSLHDGMNLVAKEFVNAKDDDDGVLILSQFTGASRELPDALIINPYDTELVADSIRRALEMDPDERRMRMRRMRRTVRDNNVYRWAASLIGDLADVQIGSGELVPRRSLTWRPATGAAFSDYGQPREI